MTGPSHYQDDSPRHPRKQQCGSSVFPVVAVLGLLGLVVGIGTVAKKSQEKKAVTATKTVSDGPVPFSSVPDEAPPDPTSRGNRTSIPADEALLADPNWTAAKALADEGYAFAEESKAAGAAGDTATYQSKARDGHDKLAKAIKMTAQWEESLVEKHGDGDPVVKSICKVRNRWFAQIRKLRAPAK